MKLVIAASPRSGTQYITKVMQSQGANFSHEELASEGGAGYMFLSSELFAEHSSEEIWYPIIRGVSRRYMDIRPHNVKPGYTIVHQVRDPLAVMSSLCNNGSPQPKFLGLQWDPDNPLKSWMNWWADTNQYVQGAIYRYRVEDVLGVFDGTLQKLCAPLGIIEDADAAKAVSTDTGTNVDNTTLHWRDLYTANWKAASRVEEMSRLFGY